MQDYIRLSFNTYEEVSLNTLYRKLTGSQFKRLFPDLSDEWIYGIHIYNPKKIKNGLSFTIDICLLLETITKHIVIVSKKNIDYLVTKENCIMYGNKITFFKTVADLYSNPLPIKNHQTFFLVSSSIDYSNTSEIYDYLIKKVASDTQKIKPINHSEELLKVIHILERKFSSNIKNTNDYARQIRIYKRFINALPSIKFKVPNKIYKLTLRGDFLINPLRCIKIDTPDYVGVITSKYYIEINKSTDVVNTLIFDDLTVEELSTFFFKKGIIESTQLNYQITKSIFDLRVKKL